MPNRQPFNAERRVLSLPELALYLGRSPAWFRRHAPELEKAGFPRPLPFLNGYDKGAVDRWLQRVGGSVALGDEEEPVAPADVEEIPMADLGESAAFENERAMGKVHIRYLVQKRGRDGPRYYWQPSADLRAHGFATQRLAEDIETAIRQAEILNRQVDDWRNGTEKDSYSLSTLPWLIQLFRVDKRFTSLKIKTRRDYDYALKKIEAWSEATSHVRLAKIQRKNVRQFYESMTDKPAMANAVIRVLRLLLQFAVDEGYLDKNPATKPRLTATPPRQGVWKTEQLASFVTKAEQSGCASMGLAVLMGIYLGQRQGDILSLTWSQFDGTAITVQQSKTGALVRVPVVRELAAALEATPRLSTTILVAEATGRPYRADHFRHEFRRIANAAGLPSLQFLDLRRSAVVRLAEAGCTTAEIAAITGHRLERTTQILETYLPRTSPMAEAAIRKLELHKDRTELDKT